MWSGAPAARAAWHVQNSKRHPDVNGGAKKVNHWSLGIEVVNAQVASDTFSDWQIEATAQIVRRCWSKYPNLWHVVSHAKLDPGSVEPVEGAGARRRRQRRRSGARDGGRRCGVGGRPAAGKLLRGVGEGTKGEAGLRQAFEEVDHAGLQRILGADDQQAVVLDQVHQNLRAVAQMVGRGLDVGADRLA